jgi:RNA polymerase sigma factor (sigma-70 family)
MFGIGSKVYTDLEIIEGFLSANHRVISYVYKHYFPLTESYILNNGGSREDAQDKFQDGMRVVFERLRSADFKLTSTFGTYLFSVCKKLWLYELRKRKDKYPVWLPDDADIPDPDEDTFELEILQIRQDALYRKHFDNLDEGCKELLRLFLKGLPFKEIREIMGFADEMQAIHRKSKCKETLTRRIQNDHEFKRLE